MRKKLIAQITPAIHERAQALGNELGLRADAVRERLHELAEKHNGKFEDALSAIETKFRTEQNKRSDLPKDSVGQYYRPNEDPAQVVLSDFQATEKLADGLFIYEDPAKSAEEDDE